MIHLKPESWIRGDIDRAWDQQRLALLPFKRPWFTIRRVMFSTTAIANFLACHHITTLERAESRGEIKKPFFKDPTVDLLRRLGLEHEQWYLRALADNGSPGILQIDIGGRWEAAAVETVEALRRGAYAVYQATFLDGLWGGRADFLLRVDKPSALGGWSYEAVETKLALLGTLTTTSTLAVMPENAALFYA